MLRGLGRAVATPILHVVYPSKYGVYNRKSEDGLRLLGLFPDLPSSASFAEQYLAVNEQLQNLSGKLEISLWQLDTLWHLLLIDSDETDNDQIIVIDASDEIDEDQLAYFSLERHLSDFLYRNWDQTGLAKDYDLYEEGGKTAQEYDTTGVGCIDLLARDKDRKVWLVIELKQGRSSDEVVGQVLRYMGWGEVHFVALTKDISQEIKQFSNESGCPLTINNFTDKFIKQSGLFTDSTFRTILTSLYGFVIEFHRRMMMLELRSSEGGSIEPFLTHLFKGCLILETILKLVPLGNTKRTLGQAIKAHATTLDMDSNNLPGHVSLNDIVKGLNQQIKLQKNYQNICFYTALGIRNTTGHKLSWEDDFLGEPELYPRLYRRMLGAIMWSIYKLWVQKR